MDAFPAVSLAAACTAAPRPPCHHLQSRHLQVEERTSKSATENERGHSIRPECRTYQGSASALNQPGLHDMLKWQSRSEWKHSGRIRHEERNTGRNWEWMWQRNSRQIGLGKATFMQVTSHIPFHLFLTTKEAKKSLWNIDDWKKPWSTSLKSLH